MELFLTPKSRCLPNLNHMKESTQLQRHQTIIPRKEIWTLRYLYLMNSCSNFSENLCLHFYQQPVTIFVEVLLKTDQVRVLCLFKTHRSQIWIAVLLWKCISLYVHYDFSLIWNSQTCRKCWSDMYTLISRRRNCEKNLIFLLSELNHLYFLYLWLQLIT